MKTNKGSKHIWLRMLLAAMIVSASLLVYTQGSQSGYNSYDAPHFIEIKITPSATRPPHCVSLNQGPVEEHSPTATPARGKGKRVPVSATATPFPNQTVYDLSPDLKEREKAFVVVYRCEGTYESYWLGPEISLNEAIQLDEGDTILQVIQPAKLVGAKPTKEPKDPYATSTIPPAPRSCIFFPIRSTISIV